ncbi:MAG: glycine betaine ABC transporter substrate-binding protein [Roseovarius sp.]|nr:glycine betaine ABC transporter substrate-binding protein [Roseovarius sp.]
MADAVMEEEPWFGYYWGPTVPLGKYDMTKVDLGEVNPEIHARNQNADTDNPGVSDFPPAPILTAVTATFQAENPEVFELMQNMTFQTSDMSAVLAWKDENNASADEAAVYYLTNYKDQWSAWLNDEARANLSGTARSELMRDRRRGRSADRPRRFLLAPAPHPSATCGAGTTGEA